MSRAKGQVIKMNNEVFIVTGAAGHLGSHVVNELLTQGRHVRALVLPHESCPDFIEENRHLLREYTGDVCDPDSLVKVFSDISSGNLIVIHCAGIVSITKKENPRVYAVNVGGTANILDACKKYNVNRLVYVSSVHAIPPLPHGQIMREVDAFDPDSVPGYYDKTKALATQLVLDAAASGLDAVVVHPSGIVGPQGLSTGNMARLMTLYVLGKLPVAVHGGFDFVDVRDVAKGIIAAVTGAKSGECYILSNRYVDLREMFDTLSKAVAVKRLKMYLPLWIAKAFAPFAEIYYRLSHTAPLFTRYSLFTLSGNAVYSHEKASRDFGYCTRSLKDTLNDTALWIKRKR